MLWTMLTNYISPLQSATFDYDIVYKVAKATSDEVRSKVLLIVAYMPNSKYRYSSSSSSPPPPHSVLLT